MKKQIVMMAVFVLLIMNRAQAALYTESFSSGRTIPDGSLVGVACSGTVSEAVGMTVSGLTISLNISGGYNAGLYAYLVAPGGKMVVLMDQPGVSADNPFGASGAGMNITLTDTGSRSLQSETSESMLSGTYRAAGSLSDFNGSAANGTWILFFADEVNGGGPSTLNSWSLELTAVPEPVNLALEVFASLVLLCLLKKAFLLNLRKRHDQGRCDFPNTHQ